jgi:hypothetical protein
MSAEPTDPTTGQPAGLVPAPDESTEQSWADQVVADGKKMILNWKETRIAYATLATFRAENGIPLISGGWSQSQDDKYWLMNDVAATLAKYMGEVDEGIRNVAYDTFGKQIAVLGDPGDFKLDYADGILTVTTTNGKASVDAAGFVGLPPVLIGVIVIVAGAVVITGFITLSGLVRDYLRKETSKDVAKQEQKIADDIIGKGGDPTQAHKTAAAITNDQLAALAAKARADAEANEKSDVGQLAKVVTTVAYVALGVAIVGGLIWFTAPMIQKALASGGSSAPRLAQQNPAGGGLSMISLDSVTVVRFNAGNDNNGNPRRVYVIMDGQGIIAAVDEGYYGPHALDHAFGEEAGKTLRNKIAGDIETTPAEYKALRKNFPPSDARVPAAPEDDLVVLHLRAKNDTSGNPRRVYVVFQGGRITNVVDEGYRGLGALPKDQQNKIAAQIDTTPAERKALLKQFGRGNQNPVRMKRHEVEDEIQSLVSQYAPDADQIFPTFEHGQWWVTVSPDPDDPSDRNSEATFSVVNTGRGLDLERV